MLGRPWLAYLSFVDHVLGRSYSVEMREQQRDAYKARDSAEFVLRNMLLGKPTDASGNESKDLANDATKANSYAQEAWPLYGMREDYGQG